MGNKQIGIGGLAIRDIDGHLVGTYEVKDREPVIIGTLKRSDPPNKELEASFVELLKKQVKILIIDFVKEMDGVSDAAVSFVSKARH